MYILVDQFHYALPQQVPKLVLQKHWSLQKLGPSSDNSRKRNWNLLKLSRAVYLATPIYFIWYPLLQTLHLTLQVSLLWKTSREWLIAHCTQHHKQQTIVTCTHSNIHAAAPGPPHVVKRPGFQPCLVLTSPCEMPITFSSTHIKLWLAYLTNNAKALLIYRRFKKLCREIASHNFQGI